MIHCSSWLSLKSLIKDSGLFILCTQFILELTWLTLLQVSKLYEVVPPILTELGKVTSLKKRVAKHKE